MPHLDYLTSVVEIFGDACFSGLFEIRTYADGWVESYFGDGLNLGYHFDSKEPV